MPRPFSFDTGFRVRQVVRFASLILEQNWLRISLDGSFGKSVRRRSLAIALYSGMAVRKACSASYALHGRGVPS